MTPEIIRRLQQLEVEQGVKILYACESGSRAWGFPSADSDYDVRFFYLHPPEWYLAIDLEKKQDVIERPINAQIDLSGWDLRKTLQLFSKSNPPLLEWLGSPIVYLEKYSVTGRLRQLTLTWYSPRACMYHYLHMARGNYRDYLKGETVWVKKYFYVLRPLLAIHWLEQGLGVVPTEFKVLVDNTVQSPALKAAIEALVKAKEQGQELDDGPRIPVISDFITAEIARLEDKQLSDGSTQRSIETLNELFRDALREVWR
ncbi:MAG: nucleotidyltransferase domain-containing protein [Anaerolineae bacterium]